MLKGDFNMIYLFQYVIWNIYNPSIWCVNKESEGERGRETECVAWLIVKNITEMGWIACIHFYNGFVGMKSEKILLLTIKLENNRIFLFIKKVNSNWHVTIWWI